MTNHTNHAHSINLDDYFFVWPKLSSNRKLNGYKIKYPRHRHAPVAFSDRFSQVQSCTGRAQFSGMGSYFLGVALAKQASWWDIIIGGNLAASTNAALGSTYLSA